MARKVIPAVTIYICDACGQQMSSEVTTPPGFVSNRAGYTAQWSRVSHNWEGFSSGPKSASYELCNNCGDTLTNTLESALQNIKESHKGQQA